MNAQYWLLVVERYYYGKRAYTHNYVHEGTVASAMLKFKEQEKRSINGLQAVLLNAFPLDESEYQTLKKELR